MRPESTEELIECVQGADSIIPAGAGTKSALVHSVPEGTETVSMTGLRGIAEYDPGEYTITVLGGTTLSEIREALAENGQYLPFDPPLARAGATIGGTVAAGMSGPGAYRFGPVRDFLIGVRFVDGDGQLVSGGGKVVKNAAGFDLPKFLIGSCGRLGILAELTFKVFPRPEAGLTFAVSAGGDAAADTIGKLGRENFELDALELDPVASRILCRIAGNADALERRAGKIGDRLGVDVEILPEAEAGAYWIRQQEFAWADPDAGLAKFPVTPRRIAELEPLFAGSDPPRRFGMGGNVLYLSAMPGFLGKAASTVGPGLVLRSPADLESPWIGEGENPPEIVRSVKAVLDQNGRFPDLRPV